MENWVDRISVMEYTTLGRTGLKVSIAGLGCAGFSRLGLGAGRSEAEAVALVRHAHDLGVNLFDTAAAYGTESVVGQAIKSAPRESVVIATKAWVPPGESRRPRCEEPRRLAPAARHRLHRHLSATRRFAQSLRRGAIHHSARAPGGSERRV